MYHIPQTIGEVIRIDPEDKYAHIADDGREHYFNTPVPNGYYVNRYGIWDMTKSKPLCICSTVVMITNRFLLNEVKMVEFTFVSSRNQKEVLRVPEAAIDSLSAWRKYVRSGWYSSLDIIDSELRRLRKFFRASMNRLPYRTTV